MDRATLHATINHCIATGRLTVTDLWHTADKILDARSRSTRRADLERERRPPPLASNR
jgi:hypothetical protein